MTNTNGKGHVRIPINSFVHNIPIVLFRKIAAEFAAELICQLTRNGFLNLMDLSVKMTVIVLGQLMQEDAKQKFAVTNPITVQVIVIVRQNILES